MVPIDYEEATQAERCKARVEYLKLQNGLCYHCKASLIGPAAPEVLKLRINRDLFPRGFFANPIHLHHSHETGMTLGIVHAYCNAVLWQYYGE